MLARHLTGRVLRTLTAPTIARNQFLRASSLVTKYDEAVSSLPMREAVRYKEHNLKLTAANFQNFVEAHANALLEYDFEEGDVLAMWMADCPEKEVTKMAAAKAGFRVVDIDPTITDIPSIRDFLRQTEVKALYFFNFDNDTEYGDLLRKSIPELFYYDNTEGQFFHSKYFPKLKFFINLGKDEEHNCLAYREIFLKNPPKSHVLAVAPSLSDDTPLYATVSKNASGGVLMTPWLKHKEVLTHPHWEFAKNLINKEYYEA